MRPYLAPSRQPTSDDYQFWTTVIHFYLGVVTKELVLISNLNHEHCSGILALQL